MLNNWVMFLSSDSNQSSRTGPAKCEGIVVIGDDKIFTSDEFLTGVVILWKGLDTGAVIDFGIFSSDSTYPLLNVMHH